MQKCHDKKLCKSEIVIQIKTGVDFLNNYNI